MRTEGCHLLITGGTGYIGTELTRTALAAGCTVTVLARSQPMYPQTERLRYVPYALTEPLNLDVFQTVNTVIHLAADTGDDPNRVAEQVEIAAGLKLFKAASTQGCRFIFVSSQSAAKDAPTPYGRIKWRIEQAVLNGGGFVVRPGLVYGGRQEAGLFGTLCDLVKSLPVLPDLRPRPVVYPIYILDLCEAFLRLASDPEARSGAYNIGAPQGISFTDFLRSIALRRMRKGRLFLPTPIALVGGLARLEKVLPWFPDLGGERALGLAALQKMNTQESLQRLNLKLTPLSVGMICGAAPARRLIAWEGYALLRYLTGRKPTLGLVKRYIMGVEFRYAGIPLPLPLLFLRFPRLFYLIDASQHFLARFEWRDLSSRFSLAVVLVEASPAGAAQFLQLKPSHGVVAWLRLLKILTKEMFIKGGQFVCLTLALLVSRARLRL